jgi:hypothetical protein
MMRTTTMRIPSLLGGAVLAGGMLAGALSLSDAPRAFAAADLSVTIAESAGTIGVGEQMTYTITMRNQGDEAAAGILMRANFFNAAAASIIEQPAGQPDCAFQPRTDADLAANRRRLECPGQILQPGATPAVVRVRVTAPAEAGTLRVTARADAANTVNESGTGDEGNNTALQTTTVINRPDLAVIELDGPEEATAFGTNLSYRVRVRNQGEGVATNVRVEVRRSANLAMDFTSVNIAGNAFGFDCTMRSPGFLAPLQIECTGGRLDPNETLTLNITGRTGAIVPFTTSSGNVVAEVDPDNQIRETRENNNRRSAGLTVR